MPLPPPPPLLLLLLCFFSLPSLPIGKSVPADGFSPGSEGTFAGAEGCETVGEDGAGEGAFCFPFPGVSTESFFFSFAFLSFFDGENNLI